MRYRQNEPQGGRLSDLVREVLEESPEAARAYLRESWLLAAIRALRDARRRAGLSQAEVAARLGTTQPAIARLENDREGRTTLHRYVDYALACGMLPLEIVVEPLESVRQFAVENPMAPRTQTCYEAWARRTAAPTSRDVATAAGAPSRDLPASARRRGASPGVWFHSQPRLEPWRAAFETLVTEPNAWQPTSPAYPPGEVGRGASTGILGQAEQPGLPPLAA